MSLGLQAKLLRVLETSLVRPVGASSERKVDARIVAATNRDLPGAGQGAQLSRRPLLSPPRHPGAPSAPARAREDVPILVEHFTREFQVRNPLLPKRELTQEAVRAAGGAAVARQRARAAQRGGSGCCCSRAESASICAMSPPPSPSPSPRPWRDRQRYRAAARAHPSLCGVGESRRPAATRCGRRSCWRSTLRPSIGCCRATKRSDPSAAQAGLADKFAAGGPGAV